MTIAAPVDIVHLQLREPLPSVAARAGCSGLLLVFWHGDLPLGELYLDPSELPLAPAQVATAAANSTGVVVRHRLVHPTCLPPPLERLDDGVPGRLAPAPLAALDDGMPAAAAALAASSAVVIATRNRPDSLRGCLTALGRLDPAPAETVVVDNSASASAREVAGAFPDVRYLHAPAGALAAARNAGMAATTQPFVAFTDDDVEVHPRWLGRVVAPFADGEVASVTGLVLPAVLETPAQLAFERTLRYLHKGYRPLRYDRRFLKATAATAAPVWRIGAGANLALRREAVAAAGGFDARLGAGAAGCSEDSELWHRLLTGGFTCIYDPAAVVFHHHRRHEPEIVQQTRDYLTGHVAGLAVAVVRSGDRGQLRRALLDLPLQLAVEASGDLWSGPLRRRLLFARVVGYVRGLALLARILRDR